MYLCVCRTGLIGHHSTRKLDIASNWNEGNNFCSDILYVVVAPNIENVTSICRWNLPNGNYMSLMVTLGFLSCCNYATWLPLWRINVERFSAPHNFRRCNLSALRDKRVQTFSLSVCSTCFIFARFRQSLWTWLRYFCGLEKKENHSRWSVFKVRFISPAGRAAFVQDVVNTLVSACANLCNFNLTEQIKGRRAHLAQEYALRVLKRVLLNP